MARPLASRMVRTPRKSVSQLGTTLLESKNWSSSLRLANEMNNVRLLKQYMGNELATELLGRRGAAIEGAAV